MFDEKEEVTGVVGVEFSKKNNLCSSRKLIFQRKLWTVVRRRYTKN